MLTVLLPMARLSRNSQSSLSIGDVMSMSEESLPSTSLADLFAHCYLHPVVSFSVLPRILIRPGGRGIVDKGSLRDGPLALIVTFVAECSMIMPLPSWNLSSVTSWQLWVWRSDAWEWGYRNQDGIHEQGVEGNTRNKLSAVIQAIRI